MPLSAYVIPKSVIQNRIIRLDRVYLIDHKAQWYFKDTFVRKFLRVVLQTKVDDILEQILSPRNVAEFEHLNNGQNTHVTPNPFSTSRSTY